MDYSKNAEQFAASFEGYSPTAIHHPEDPENVWTLGFGSTYWTTNGKTSRVVEGMTCTRDEALAQLGIGLGTAAKCVDGSVTVVLEQNEFDSLSDFCYNLGCSRWMGSTARARLNAGDYKGAAEAFLMWDRAGGKVMAGLLRRRQAEEKLFETAASTTPVTS
jgi:lysozyme